MKFGGKQLEVIANCQPVIQRWTLMNLTPQQEINEMEDSVMNWILLGVISWTTLFLGTRKLFPKRSLDFCSRIVSTVHASLAVVLASASVEDWSCPVCPLASKPSSKQIQTLAITIAYFLYDLVGCLFDTKQFKLDYTIHHLVSIVGLGAGLFYQMCGSEMVAALWITEVSSPFLHLREILKEIGYRDTDLNLAADISFATIFTLARMIGGPYLTYIVLSADIPLIMKSMAVGMQLVSAFWFYKIARMVAYKLTKKNVASYVPIMDQYLIITKLLRGFSPPYMHVTNSSPVKNLAMHGFLIFLLYRSTLVAESVTVLFVLRRECPGKSSIDLNMAAESDYQKAVQELDFMAQLKETIADCYRTSVGSAHWVEVSSEGSEGGLGRNVPNMVKGADEMEEVEAEDVPDIVSGGIGFVLDQKKRRDQKIMLQGQYPVSPSPS